MGDTTLENINIRIVDIANVISYGSYRPIFSRFYSDGVRPGDRIALVTLHAYTGGLLSDECTFCNRSITDKLEYAERHQYDLFVFDKLDKSRREVWSKIPALLKVLSSERDYRWVVWVDADVIFTNHALPLSVFVPPPYTPLHINYPHILVTADCNFINAGVFIIANTKFAVEFLLATRTQRAGEFQNTFSEQGAISELWKHHPKSVRPKIAFLPQHWINAYAGPWCGVKHSRNMLIIHLAGLDEMKDKEWHFTKYYNNRVGLNGTSTVELYSYQKKIASEVAIWWKEWFGRVGKHRNNEDELEKHARVVEWN
eukprot:CFRG5846T1